MKNCAVRIASAGGRCWISPARLAAAVTIVCPMEAPTATPSTVRIASLTRGTPFSGAFRDAAAKQPNIGPSSSGNGRPNAMNAPTPITAIANVPSCLRSIIRPISSGYHRIRSSRLYLRQREFSRPWCRISARRPWVESRHHRVNEQETASIYQYDSERCTRARPAAARRLRGPRQRPLPGVPGGEALSHGTGPGGCRGGPRSVALLRGVM